MSGRRSYRALDGILLLDKRAGISSNKALQEVRHLYQARKAGHTGALDPLATGLLPVCFGEATKFSTFLLDADKRYVVTAALGARTDTGDADGAVVETAPVPEFDTATLQRALAGLTGPIEQVPPMYSALKRDGRPLYALAREGREVERAPRPVTIHAFTLTGRPAPNRLELEVRCSKGTYVRTLVEDLARALGTRGHVAALRRLGVGPFDGPGHAWETVQGWSAAGGLAGLDAHLLPPDAAVASLPRADLSPDMAHFIRHGQPVRLAPGATTGPLRLYGPGGRFLGLGERGDDGVVTPKRLVATRPAEPGADGSA